MPWKGAARLLYDTTDNTAPIVWEARLRTSKVENTKLIYKMANIAVAARAGLQGTATAKVGHLEAHKYKGHLGMKTTTPSLDSTISRKLCTTASAHPSSLDA
jgi:hypothetical protein